MVQNISEKDDLEHEQAVKPQQQRREIDGNEANLTELAAPTSASANPERKDFFEDEERFAHSEKSRHQSVNDDEPVTELAAPVPIEKDSESEPDENVRCSDSPKNSKVKPSLRQDGPPSRTARYCSELFVVSWIILMSIFGTLARLATESLTTYPGTPFPSTVLWANLGGSFFMGFLVQDRIFFRSPTSYTTEASSTNKEEEEKHQTAYKKGLPIYIGLTTGFCGSFTSFSTFITDAFKALTNDLPVASPTMPYRISTAPIPPRNGGYSFMATLAILIVHPAVSYAAYVIGAHLATALQSLKLRVPAHTLGRTVNPAMVITAVGSWIGAVMLAIWPPAQFWRHRAVFPIVFAPVGALTRFYLSKHLNGRIAAFPLGTFVANIFGTCIEGMCFDLQHAVTTTAGGNGSIIGCAVLAGIQEGFCGCLTTVSTWMAELNTLQLKHRYLYGLATLSVGISCQIIIMGSVGWSYGFGSPACEGDVG